MCKTMVKRYEQAGLVGVKCIEKKMIEIASGNERKYEN